MRDFVGGPVVKNPPSSAEDVDSIPGQGTKIPRIMKQLSLHVTTTEAHVLEPASHNLSLPGTTAEFMCRNKRSRVLQLRPDTAK